MKRKVLIIVENAGYPFDARVRNEALALLQEGYDITVICPRDKHAATSFEVVDGVRVYRHPSVEQGNGRMGYLIEYSSALIWEFLYAWRIYLRHGFQVIQGCNPPDTIFLIALPFKLLGVRYIFDHHDVNPELYESKYSSKGFLHKVLLLLERLTYLFCDVIIATNESYRDLAVSRGGLAKEDVFVVRNGPKEEFKAIAPNPDRKFGKPYLVGYVGNMDVQDGLDILLDVALRIRELGRNDVHFTCVGGGPQLELLRQMVREKGLTEMVNFTGRVSDEELLEVLSTADVCVNPDKPCQMNNISTMIKIMEYMALGKPIVQFDAKEGKFSAQEASLYADPQQPINDFADKILCLLDNPEYREKMGAFGKNRIEKELAWKHSVPQLLAAYDRAFSKRHASY